MERVETIMEKLGFKKDSEDSVKAAFVKNLIKQAYGVDVKLPPQYETKERDLNGTLDRVIDETFGVSNSGSKKQRSSFGQDERQLSFDLEEAAPKVG